MHGVIAARKSSSATRSPKGVISGVLPTSASMKRPVANGMAIPAMVAATRSGEYANTITGDDRIVCARNFVCLNRLCNISFAFILYIYDVSRKI